MADQRREFDRHLEAIDVKVVDLFAVICEDLPTVTQALLSGNSEVAGQLADRDRTIDSLYQEIEQLASREILLQAADSWYQRDASSAPALARVNDEMSELHAGLIAGLGSSRMSSSVIIEMALVARFYERLGDHAVNILRRLSYLAGSTTG